MIIILTILVIFGSFLGVASFIPATKATYYEVNLDRVEQIHANTKFEDWSGLKARKVNKTRSLNGDIYFYKDFGDEVIVKIEASIKRGGVYQMLPYRIPEKPLCKFYMDEEYFYKELAENSDFPKDVKTGCPLKAGKYSWRSVIFNLDSIPRALIVSGDYSGDFIHILDGEEILRMRFFASVVAA